ncbi:MAG: hypothetical protein VXA41_01750 [Euryarchaeota archaeon]
MEEEQNSGTLDGTTEPAIVDAGRVFVNTGQNFPVQKNAAAKVIGILVIIWGAFNLLGSPLTLLSDIGATDLNGNEISYPIEYFAAFLVAWIGSIISSSIAGSAMDSEGIGFGAGLGAAQGICGIFCYAICGIIVAIPLMLSDGGME